MVLIGGMLGIWIGGAVADLESIVVARVVAGSLTGGHVPPGTVAVAVTVPTAARFGLHPGGHGRRPVGPENVSDATCRSRPETDGGGLAGAPAPQRVVPAKRATATRGRRGRLSVRFVP